MRMRAMIALTLASCTTCDGQHTIDLSAIRLDLPSMGLVVDSVVSTYHDRACIGTTARNNEPVYLNGPVNKTLTALCQRSLPTDAVQKHVLLKVNALRVEAVNIGERGRVACSLHVEFIERDSLGLVRTYDHGLRITDKMIEAKDKEAGVLKAAFETAIKAYWKRHLGGRLGRAAITELDQPTPAIALELPITRAERARRGIYHTFQDFRYDIIDTSIQFEVKDITDAGDPRAQLRMRSQDFAAHEAWGCADGKHVFINFNDRFIELMPEDGTFTTFLSINVSDPAAQAAAIGVAGLFFGAIGGAVAGAATTEIIERKYRLDLLQGTLILYDYDGVSLGSATSSADGSGHGSPSRSRHVFSFSKNSMLDTTVCLYIYGGQEACLKRNKHFNYRPVRRPEKLDVELRIGDVPVASLALDTNDPRIQFFLIKVNEYREVSVDRVSDQMASDLLNHLDPSLEVKGPPR